MKRESKEKMADAAAQAVKTTCRTCLVNYDTRQALVEHVCMTHMAYFPWECSVCRDKYAGDQENRYLRTVGVSAEKIRQEHAHVHKDMYSDPQQLPVTNYPVPAKEKELYKFVDGPHSVADHADVLLMIDDSQQQQHPPSTRKRPAASPLRAQFVKRKFLADPDTGSFTGTMDDDASDDDDDKSDSNAELRGRRKTDTESPEDKKEKAVHGEEKDEPIKYRPNDGDLECVACHKKLSSHSSLLRHLRETRCKKRVVIVHGPTDDTAVKTEPQDERRDTGHDQMAPSKSPDPRQALNVSEEPAESQQMHQEQNKSPTRAAKTVADQENGACPNCHKHFKDVKRHLRSCRHKVDMPNTIPEQGMSNTADTSNTVDTSNTDPDAADLDMKVKSDAGESPRPQNKDGDEQNNSIGEEEDQEEVEVQIVYPTKNDRNCSACEGVFTDYHTLIRHMTKTKMCAKKLAVYQTSPTSIEDGEHQCKICEDRFESARDVIAHNHFEHPS